MPFISWLRVQNKAQLDALQRQNEALQALDKAKDHFLSIASHELRTPLTIIKGYAEFLQGEGFGTLNSQQREFVSKIQGSTDELLELITRMLDLSRLEAGKMEFELLALDLGPFLEEILESFTVLYASKKVDLKLDTAGLEPQVLVDRDKLTIIMTNLLSNAYKFTPEGGRVRVSLQPAADENLVKIVVTDDGVGIPADKQHLIFNKFQQAENGLEKSYCGSGLGLNITQQMVEHLGGEIWVESEGRVKKGSRFIFTVPYA